MYREMVNSELGRASKSTAVAIFERRAKAVSSNNKSPKPASRKDKIEGESDETTRRTRHQISRLTEKQRAILITTFKELEINPVKNALRVLVMLFSEVPHYKLIWPQFRAIPDSSLMNAVELRRHASVYMCGLGAIIHSMTRENDLAVQMKPNRKGAHQMECASDPYR
ncbi:hypothetical protein OSTOST_17105, partial [Ostertagia ostertagi]